MLFLIFKYEWLYLKANKLMLLLASITALLTFFALYDGYARVSFQQATLQQIAAQEKADYAKYRAQIEAAGPGQHFDGGHFGDPTNPFYFGNRMGAKYAVLQPAALAIIAAGQSDIYPYYYKITLSKKQALYHSEELENPGILFNGRFDLAFVIIFLLPLLIIAFTYNIYSSEKDNGTLPLLMAQNTPVHKIIAWRFLFRYLLFNIFFTLLTVIGLVCFAVDVCDAPGLASVIGITWLYTAFWFSPGYLFSSSRRSSGYVAGILTGIWLMLVLIIPTIISNAIDVIHPMPSRLDLITQTRNISDSIAKSKNVLNRFLDEHPEFKPANADPNDRNPATLRNRIEVELAMEKVKATYTAMAAKRESVVDRYRFLSPAIFLQKTLNRTAGTDDARYKEFEKKVAGYQQQFRNYFEPLVYRQQKFTVANLDGVPVFQ
jgi:ABC-2 type transport system permease protein